MTLVKILTKGTKMIWKNKEDLRSDGKRVNRPLRIRLTTHDIANYIETSEGYIRTANSRKLIDLNNPDMWTRFWSLVKYLEYKGLRPNN